MGKERMQWVLSVAAIPIALPRAKAISARSSNVGFATAAALQRISAAPVLLLVLPFLLALVAQALLLVVGHHLGGLRAHAHQPLPRQRRRVRALATGSRQSGGAHVLGQPE